MNRHTWRHQTACPDDGVGGAGPMDEPANAKLEWKRLEGECNACRSLLLTLPDLSDYAGMVVHAMANATRAAMRGEFPPHPYTAGALFWITIMSYRLTVWLLPRRPWHQRQEVQEHWDHGSIPCLL